MECEFPTINSDTDEIREIFKSVKSIAIIGLSPDSSKASHKVASYLQQAGYKIVPIYPKEETILNEKVYRSLSEVPFKLDMVDIFRKSAAFNDIADAAIARGDIRVFWGQIGLVNNEAATKAKNAGMAVVQSRCAMVEHKALGDLSA